MKAFQLHGQTGPDSLRLVELPEPKPGHGQVLVRVRANALNYRDLMIADGRYGKVNLPLVPLSDGAGEIAAVGEGVSRWKTGDRVAGSFFQGGRGGIHQGRFVSAKGFGGDVSEHRKGGGGLVLSRAVRQGGRVLDEREWRLDDGEGFAELSYRAARGRSDAVSGLPVDHVSAAKFGRGACDGDFEHPGEV